MCFDIHSNKSKVCFLSPEIYLSKRLQELSANQPIRAVLQGHQINEQLQAKFTETAIAQRHDTVLWLSKHTQYYYNLPKLTDKHKLAFFTFKNDPSDMVNVHSHPNSSTGHFTRD